MKAGKKGKRGGKQGGGDPGEGGAASCRKAPPKPGSPPRAARAGSGGEKRGPGRPKGARYSPEERRHLLESFAKSGMDVGTFCATVGVGVKSLYRWRQEYEAKGPKGLEPKPLGRPKGSGTGSRLPEAVKAAVVETKRRFPIFGLQRIGDWLARFRGLKVSPGSVAKVLKEAAPALPPAPGPRRKPRRRKLVRRFERARPGSLWQTDITSFVLTRHHVRVYLVAYIDDHSRFIVSWSLSTSAKKGWVADCLMEGVAKYGKPEEVFTDQGPQYFSWRGKSSFQKLLVKQGIKHVVARSHHPQSLGKIERLWRTVGEEFWDRAHPQELDDARERLGLFFSFYNFFRPHQGIEGGIPAERFFGAAEAVKRMTAERIERNVLQLALGETPRRTAFLVGQVGDRAVSLHGERGKLVMQTDEGVYEALGLEDLGMARKEASDDGAAEGSGGGVVGEPGHGAGASPAADASADAAADAAAGGGGAGAVGPGDGGGEGAGARHGHGDPVVVAGGEPEAGGAGEARGDGAADVAAVADGAERDGGGTASPAQDEGEGAAGDSRGGEPDGAEAEGDAAGAGPPCGPGAGGAAPDAPLVEEGWHERR
jgi:transposase InsO family protein/transposase-like protein